MYLRKLHPVEFEINKLNEGKQLTVENRSDPMENCSPGIDPRHKLQIIWWIGLSIEDIEYRLAEHTNGS